MEIVVIIMAIVCIGLMAVVVVMMMRLRDNGTASKSIGEEQRRVFDSQLQQLRADFERRETELQRRNEELQRQTTIQFENLSNRVLRNQSEELGRRNMEQIRNSKVQGDWGEQLLQELLEKLGLKEGVHFTSQDTRDSGGGVLKDESGKMLRPDFILHLPGERKLIVDSKVSLTAFADYAEATDEDARKNAAKRLVRSVRSHVDELKTKQYQKTVKGSAEQVLMFMPVEGAYFLAMDTDSKIAIDALQSKVVIVTPTHLFSVVGLIEQMWRVENQNRNAAEIARIGGLLYDRMAAFAKDFESVADCIQRTQKAYEKCQDDITKGPQSILARAEKMKKLGAKTSKPLPERFAQTIKADSEEGHSETAS